MKVLVAARHKYRGRRFQEIKDSLYKITRILQISPRELEQLETPLLADFIQAIEEKLRKENT